MSTSRNWTVWVEDYLKYFDGELLRYVLAANAPETKDSDFTWKDFQNKINNDLNNVLGNLANRTFIFAKKYFDGKIRKPGKFSELSDKILNESYKLTGYIGKSFNSYQVRKATKLVMNIARIGNKYFDETKPWKEIKTNKEKAEETLFVCTEILRLISISFSPIVPKAMKKLRKMMNLSDDFKWGNIEKTPKNFEIGEVSPLFKKIEDAEIEKQLELLKATQTVEEKTMQHKKEIEFEDFDKLEIRVVKIIEAENIPKSNKLIKLRIKLGNEERTIVAGIKESYEPEELIGKKVAMLLNLKPRKLMGIESQGMILAAEDDGKYSIIIPQRDVKEGSEIS